MTVKALILNSSFLELPEIDQSVPRNQAAGEALTLQYARCMSGLARRRHRHPFDCLNTASDSARQHLVPRLSLAQKLLLLSLFLCHSD